MEGFSVRKNVGVTDGDAVRETVDEVVGLTVGDDVWVGVKVGVVGVAEGFTVGSNVEKIEGATVGVGVGSSVVIEVGMVVGFSLRDTVGFTVAKIVGNTDDSSDVGMYVGRSVGVI